MSKKLTIYLASGWFTPRTIAIRDELERRLEENPNIDLFSPMRDGVKLPPNQKHDTELRESIFKDNIKHILDADLVVANIDSMDSYNDPGTIYEVGYAMAKGIPVVGFADAEDNLMTRFKGLIDGFDCIAVGYDELEEYLEDKLSTKGCSVKPNKVLFVGSGDEEVDKDLAALMMDTGANLRWLDANHNQVAHKIDEIFEGVEYMVAVIDDRKTLVSWMIGQAYARNIPVVTYSNHNYMINIMLLVSVLTHIRGKEELVKFISQVKREGLESIPKFDISEINAC